MLNTMFITGSIRHEATSLGVTRNCTGLTAKVVKASTCSVIRMDANSVAMPDPARAVIMRAVKTGASSRASEMPTPKPT